MKPTIQVHDKHFEVFIEKQIIENKIQELASKINLRDTAGCIPAYCRLRDAQEDA